MTQPRGWRALVSCLLLGLTGAADAQALTPAVLQRLLQQASKPDMRFHEQRESRWLATPVVSTGTLTLSATMLEKRIDAPKRETWRILGDRMQLFRSGSDGITEFIFDRVPAVSVLAHALRHAVAGDLQALDQDFQLSLTGTESRWTVSMKPRRPGVAQYLKEMELQGSGGRLQLIVISESQGDRTSTRLFSDD